MCGLGRKALWVTILAVREKAVDVFLSSPGMYILQSFSKHLKRILIKNSVAKIAQIIQY